MDRKERRTLLVVVGVTAALFCLVVVLLIPKCSLLQEIQASAAGSHRPFSSSMVWEAARRPGKTRA
jgi:hypothetical protein